MGFRPCRRRRRRLMCTTRRRVGQSAFGQCGAASGAIVYRVQRAGRLSADQYDRLVERDGERIIKARAMPGGRCFWKVGWIGSRWGFRPLIWSSRRPKKPPRARLRWPLVCRRCCWAYRGCDLCQLSGGQPGVLPSDRVAVGDTGGGDLRIGWAHYGRSALNLSPIWIRCRLGGRAGCTMGSGSRGGFLTRRKSGVCWGLPALGAGYGREVLSDAL